MFLFAAAVLSLAFAFAMFALYWYGRHEFLSVRDDLDRTREEKDIIIEFLHKMVEDISVSDRDALYARIVRSTALICGAMGARIYEKNPDGSLVAKATEGLFPPFSRRVSEQDSSQLRSSFLEKAIEGETIDPKEGILGAVVSDARGVLVRNGERDPRIMRHGDSSLAIKSAMAVPMAFGGNVYGVLAVVNPISGKSFSETDFSLAKSLGEQAGLAIHNKDAVSALILKSKLEFDLRLASSVQRYLLPEKLPDTKNMEFAVNYQPQQLIGGDFYDFIRFPDGRIGIVIGDVSGKGISAAILMALCQSKLAYLAQSYASPSEALKALNREMVAAMRADMFVTMLYAIVEADASRITVARAGHEAPLFCRPSEVRDFAEKMRAGGMAVGMVEPELFDSAIEDVSFNLESGDIMVFYTDGVTEASAPDGSEFSTERLSRSVANLSALSPAELNSQIMRELAKFVENNEYSDDLTLLSVKIK